ncbi:hypothetical protein [Massilia sp. LjRoot122]|uniref:hypothetical protein n=1 Tax=Massilia sp. LjRoot122 TaxID=3342257 RepID=UPI003ECFA468
MTGLAKTFSGSLDGRYPNPDEAAELYRLRALDVKALQSKPVITLADIQALDRLGRFHIANESFDKCDAEAQHALRHDAHHSVRSAVVTFRPARSSNNGAALAA